MRDVIDDDVVYVDRVRYVCHIAVSIHAYMPHPSTEIIDRRIHLGTVYSPNSYQNDFVLLLP